MFVKKMVVCPIPEVKCGEEAEETIHTARRPQGMVIVKIVCC